MKKKKKKNKSHPIPKDQRILWTPGTQLIAVLLFLEGKSYNSITKILKSHTKREWKEMGVNLKEIKLMEGRAVERKVLRLFKGVRKRDGQFVPELPKFDRLPNRTGQFPLHTNEIRCIKYAIEYKRSIDMISRLTGRSKKEIREITGGNKKSLLD